MKAIFGLAVVIIGIWLWLTIGRWIARRFGWPDAWGLVLVGVPAASALFYVFVVYGVMD
jgi:hypothetical protein